ncbi:MAG: hypothetical protein Q9170_008254 [Blastenia crenularia]
MGKKRKHLSHEEIWDDSALLNSWDEALQEYQLYHSIHVHGENVEDVLREAESAQEVPIKSDLNTNGFSSDVVNGLTEPDDIEDGEVADDYENVDYTPVPLPPHSAAAGAKEEAVAIKEELPRNQQPEIPTTALHDTTQHDHVPQNIPGILIGGGMSDLRTALSFKLYHLRMG